MNTYAELYAYMMPIALENGIGIDEFEVRTFRELEYMIKANTNAHNRKVKADIMLKYQMVDLMAASLGRIMSDKATYPEIYEIYPTIFGDELEKSIKEERQRLEAEQLTMRWKQYAMGHNATFKPKTEGEK